MFTYAGSSSLLAYFEPLFVFHKWQQAPVASLMLQFFGLVKKMVEATLTT